MHAGYTRGGLGENDNGGDSGGDDGENVGCGAREPSECHCFDNLLWYFVFMHRQIRRVALGRQAAYVPVPPQIKKSDVRRRQRSTVMERTEERAIAHTAESAAV